MTTRTPAFLLAMLLAAPAAAQAPGAYRTDGPELFQAWFKLAGVEPISRTDFFTQQHDAADTIVVVWNTERVGRNALDWSAAVRSSNEKGGAAIVLSNEPAELGQLLAGWPGIRTPGNVALAGEHGDNFRVVWNANLKPPFSELMRTSGVAPRNLEHIDTPLPRKLFLPALVGPFKQPLAIIQDWNWTFGVGGEGPAENPYRFLFFADQGLFSNEMLLDSNLDNYWLALNTVRFLRGPQKRSRCLFLVNGQVVEQFPLEFTTPPLPDLPLPGWRQLQTLLTDAANKSVERLEAQDVVNRSLLRGDSNRRLANILQTLGMIAAVCAVLYLLRKVLKSRQPADPLLTSKMPATQAHTLLGRRGEELLRQDNLIELGRAAAQRILDSMHPPAAEPLVIAFPRGEPSGLRDKIVKLWRLAYDPEVATLHASRWSQFERNLAEVREAAEKKLWYFDKQA